MNEIATISCTKKLFEVSGFVEEHDPKEEDELYKWHALFPFGQEEQYDSYEQQDKILDHLDRTEERVVHFCT